MIAINLFYFNFYKYIINNKFISGRFEFTVEMGVIVNNVQGVPTDLTFGHVIGTSLKNMNGYTRSAVLNFELGSATNPILSQVMAIHKGIA